MFIDPLKNELIDYVGGRADLDAKVLRAIGNPSERFTEDKLRILRAVRMAARFDLAIDADTLAAAKRMAAEIQIVSAERIAEELRKMLAHPNRARSARLLREFGLIEPVLPELVQTFTLSSAWFQGTRWDHTVRMIEALECNVSFPLAFATLLHSLNTEKVEEIADRLRLSSVEKTRIAWLVAKQHSLEGAPMMRASKLFLLLVAPGILELLALNRADAIAGGNSLAHVEFCEKVLRETPRDVLNPVPLITGDDLIALGMKPGKEFKRLLDAAREAQLDGLVKDQKQALELVQQLRQAERPAPEKPPE
jgi:poly(A) polymerase